MKEERGIPKKSPLIINMSKKLYAVKTFKDTLDSVDPKTLRTHECVQYMSEKQEPIYLRQGTMIADSFDDELDAWLKHDSRKSEKTPTEVAKHLCSNCFYLNQSEFRELRNYLADKIASRRVYIDEFQNMTQLYKKLKSVENHLEDFAGFVYVCTD